MNIRRAHPQNELCAKTKNPVFVGFGWLCISPMLRLNICPQSDSDIFRITGYDSCHRPTTHIFRLKMIIKIVAMDKLIS